MFLSFHDAGTHGIFAGIDSNRARRAHATQVLKVARRKVEWMDAAGALGDLRSAPANQLEALKGDRRGEYSIRLNDQYRICFVWTVSGPAQVEIVDYHS